MINYWFTVCNLQIQTYSQTYLLHQFTVICPLNTHHCPPEWMEICHLCTGCLEHTFKRIYSLQYREGSCCVCVSAPPDSISMDILGVNQLFILRCPWGWNHLGTEPCVLLQKTTRNCFSPSKPTILINCPLISGTDLGNTRPCLLSTNIKNVKLPQFIKCHLLFFFSTVKNNFQNYTTEQAQRQEVATSTSLLVTFKWKLLL